MGCSSVQYSQLESTRVVRLIAIMATKIGRSYQAPETRYVEFPDYPFEWRQTTFKAADVFKLVQLLAVLGVAEISAAWNVRNELGKPPQGEWFTPSAPLLVEVGAVCTTVLLRFLTSSCGHRKRQWWVATTMIMVYVFAPALSLAVAEYCQAEKLTLDFPRVTSSWVIGFIASRALEHYIIQKCDGYTVKIENGLEDTCFVATNWMVIFCYWVIQELCGTVCPRPLHQGERFLWYCVAVVLNLLFMYGNGASKQRITERCLRRYLFKVKVGLVGTHYENAVDGKEHKPGEGTINLIKKTVTAALGSIVLWVASFLLQCRIQDVPWVICLPLSVVMSSSLVFSLHAVLTMGRNVGTNYGNNACWFNQDLHTEFEENTFFWKTLLGPDPELFLLCFTEREIKWANAENYKYLKEQKIEYKAHPMATELDKAVKEVGQNEYWLFFPELSLKVVYGSVVFFKAVHLTIFYGGWSTQLKDVTQLYYDQLSPVASYLVSTIVNYLCSLWNCTACTKLEDQVQEDLVSLIKCLDYPKALGIVLFVVSVCLLSRYVLFRLIAWAVREHLMQFISSAFLGLAVFLSWHVLSTVRPREDQWSNAGLEVCKGRLLHLEKETSECQSYVRVIGRVVPNILYPYTLHKSQVNLNSRDICPINDCSSGDACGEASRKNIRLIAREITFARVHIGHQFSAFNISDATVRLQNLGRLQAEAQDCVQPVTYLNTSLVPARETPSEPEMPPLFTSEILWEVLTARPRKCLEGLLMGGSATDHFWNCVPFPRYQSNKRKQA